MDDEDDSFNWPIPCSRPIEPKVFDQKETKIEDPDSDDSFDNFQPSQCPQPSSIKVFSNLNTQSTQKIAPSTQTNNPSFVKFTPKIHNSVQIVEPKVLQNQNNQKPITPTVIKPIFPKATTSKPQHLPRSSSGTGNSSFTRHGSDNSFFRPQTVAKSTPNNTPAVPKTSPILFAPSSQRPGTPSGEVLMLRGQLENIRKEKAKMTAEMQKKIKEITDKHSLEAEEQKKKYEQLMKENEILKTTSACRTPNQNIAGPSGLVQQNTSPHQIEVRKVCPKIPSSKNNNMKAPSVVRPYVGKSGVTPRRTVNVPRQLSAFRHERPLGIDSGDDTFILEDSFEPTATSTPRTTCIHKTPSLRRPFDLNSLSNGMDDLERGAPVSKRKPSEPPKRPRTRQEVLAKSREFFEKFEGSEQYIDMVYQNENSETENKDDSLIGCEQIDNEYIDSYLATQLDNLKALKKRENMPKSMKNKFNDPVYSSPSCSRCHISDMQSLPTTSEKKNRKKDWKEAERLRVEKEMKKAEMTTTKMYNEMLQSLTRRGMEQVEATRAARNRADAELEEKKKWISSRTLDDIRCEVKEKWRSEILGELQEKGELNARLTISKRSSAVENNDCVWTSDSEDEDDFFASPCFGSFVDKWTLCDRCAKKQTIERRISRRNYVKNEVVLDTICEYGKEQREHMRNMSILTKSKIEAADMELNRELDKLNGIEDDSF